MQRLRVGMRGKVKPSFASQYERGDDGKWVIVSSPMPCRVIGVYERFVTLEFECVRGEVVRESFLIGDRALDVKWTDGED